MKTLVRRAKARALSVMKAAGAFEILRDSRWRAHRLLILCYHGVSIDDEHEWNPSLYMSLERFESRLDTLRRGGYTVLPLREALAAVSADALPPRSVTITFDDGTHDFYERAFPALEARGFPVTVYLTTYYCEFQAPVYSVMCSYLLWKGRDRPLALRDVLGGSGEFDLRRSGARESAWRALIEVSDRERHTAGDKQRTIERLAGALGIDLAPLRARKMLQIMPPSEVEELAARGVDFQLHTHRHRTPLDRELFQREIRDNRVRIERLTQAQPAHFCYPSGHYRPEFLPWLEEAQVSSATTCDPGLVTPRSEQLKLPRFVDTSEVSPLVFEGWLTGAASWLPRRQTYAER